MPVTTIALSFSYSRWVRQAPATRAASPADPGYPSPAELTGHSRSRATSTGTSSTRRQAAVRDARAWHDSATIFSPLSAPPSKSGSAPLPPLMEALPFWCFEKAVLSSCPAHQRCRRGLADHQCKGQGLVEGATRRCAFDQHVDGARCHVLDWLANRRERGPDNL